MYFDLLDQMMSAYAPTSTGTTNTPTTGPYLDRTVAMEDGAGEPLFFYGEVATTATSGGSATVQFLLLGNPSDPTFASGNVTVYDSGAIAVATLAAGYQFARAPIPRRQAGGLETTGLLLRYYQTRVVIATAALTAGAFNSWLTTKPLQDNLSYARNYTV